MSTPQKQQVRVALHETLYRLEYAAFEQVMKRLLYQSGYLSVHLIGRNHQPGHTPTGGLDLAARSMTELTSVLTIAQVKQYRGVVPRRFVDELRGAMLRLGAEQGLLLTLSRFSQAAHTAAKSKVAPVKLIEGAEILDLLFVYRIGVSVKNGVWELDHAWLDTLPKRAIGTYDKTTSPKNQRALSTGPNRTEKLTSVPALPGEEQPQEATNPFNDESRTMTWSTHLMAGLNSLWIIEAFPTEQVFSNENFALTVAAAALGSLLPDLDAAESKIKHLQVGGVKPFLLPSQLIHRQTGHRSLLHSLMALVYVALLGIVIAACLEPIAAFALWLGYATHLMADACTRAGIPLLYPRPKRFHILPKQLRIVTGSQAEDVIFALLSLSVIALLLRHLLTI